MNCQELTLPFALILLTCVSMPTHAQVRSHQKISDTAGGFAGILTDFDSFGAGIAGLGDLDGNGRLEYAVGAQGDDDGGIDRGAVWILSLFPNGTVAAHTKISDTQGGFTGVLDNTDGFGFSVASLGDLDGDGTGDLAVGAPADDDGGVNNSANRGAVWILFLNPDGSVRNHQKISQAAGGFTGTLSQNDHLGYSIAAMPDLDGDGVVELLVGAPGDDAGAGTDTGAVWVLFLNPNGTVKGHTKIANGASFGGTLVSLENFGVSIAVLGTSVGAGVPTIAVGSPGRNDGGFQRGAVWILSLNSSGTVSSYQRISSTAGGFPGSLADEDAFGFALTSLGDLDHDGITDLGVSAGGDDGSGLQRGAAWILFLATGGTVRGAAKIGDGIGGFPAGVLGDGDLFSAIALDGSRDVDGDGNRDLVAGAVGDDDGGPQRGAAYVLFLDCLGPAVSTPRNGSGTNPAGFTQQTAPILGTSWHTTVDIVLPGALASLVAVGLGGPISGIHLNGFVQGELLGLGPYWTIDVALGSHAIALPLDCGLLGRHCVAQGATFSPGAVRLNNALDLILGTF